MLRAECECPTACALPHLSLLQLALTRSIAIANISGAVAPFLFAANTAPRYFPGLITLFAFLAAAMAITAFLWYKLGGSSEYRVTADEQPQAAEDEDAGEKKTQVVGDVQEVPAEEIKDEVRRA